MKLLYFAAMLTHADAASCTLLDLGMLQIPRLLYKFSCVNHRHKNLADAVVCTALFQKAAHIACELINRLTLKFSGIESKGLSWFL